MGTTVNRIAHNAARRVSKIADFYAEGYRRYRAEGESVAGTLGILADPRSRTGWAIRNRAMPLERLGCKILGETQMSDMDIYRQGYEDGRKQRPTRDQIAAVLEFLGYEATDQNLARLGFGPLAD